MKASEALIAWTPKRWNEIGPEVSGQVRVGPLITEDDGPDWTDAYACTGGAAHVARRTLPLIEQVAAVFVEFHSLVVGDGIDPLVAHEAFLAIDEYRTHIAPDILGASPE